VERRLLGLSRNLTQASTGYLPERPHHVRAQVCGAKIQCPRFVAPLAATRNAVGHRIGLKNRQGMG